MSTNEVHDRVRATLEHFLREGVDIHRCAAAQALGRMRDGRAVDGLIAALLDEDEDVRVDAATALAAFADPKAAKPLLDNLLGDPCNDVKLAAIDGLIAMKEPEVVPWLRKLLKGRDEEIVWDEEEVYHSEWDDWLDIQSKAVAGLGELGIEEAAAEIGMIFDDEDAQDISDTAFRALTGLGETGFKVLGVFLTLNNPRYRRRAATAAAISGDDRAAPLVDKAFRDESPDVRLAVARTVAAGDAGDDRLAALLDDASADVRAEVLGLVGAHHPDRLAAALEDVSAKVVKTALALIARHPRDDEDGTLAERLEALLENEDPDVAAAAAEAYGAVLGADALETLAERSADTALEASPRLGAVRGLGRIGADAAAALAEIVGDDDRRIRLEAMSRLARFAAREDWPNGPAEVLLAGLQGELTPLPGTETESEPEEATATETAEEETPPEAGEDEPALDAEDQEEVAEEDLWRIAPGGSTLEAILNDGQEAEHRMRQDSGDVELTEEDMDLLEISQERRVRKKVVSFDAVAAHEDVPLFAARLLGDVARDEVALALAETLDGVNPDLHLAALDSLARIAEKQGSLPYETVQRLMGIVEGGARDVRLLALRALGKSGGRGASNTLGDYLNDDDSFVQIEAIRALDALGEKDERLYGLLGHGDSGVRLNAAETLARVDGEDAVDALVEAAFAFEGYHRREIAKLLRDVGADAASRRFLGVLDDEGRRREWIVALEALEEIHAVNGRDPERRAAI